MKQTLASVVVALSLAGRVLPGAAEDGGAQSGAAIAKAECSSCHRLPDGSGTVFGPDFDTIAHETDLSPAWLEEILGKSPHAGVVQVDPNEIGDLVAWLNGLGAAR